MGSVIQGDVLSFIFNWKVQIFREKLSVGTETQTENPVPLLLCSVNVCFIACQVMATCGSALATFYSAGQTVHPQEKPPEAELKGHHLT